MVRLISYPFRFSGNKVVTTEDGADYYAEELAMLIKTNPGERELVPDYGIVDPTFNDLNRTELLEKISLFGPPVTIEASSSEFLRDGKIAVNVVYSEIPLGTLNDIEDEEDDEDFGDDDEDEYDEESEEFNFIDATDF